ncbi:MAG: anthranilate phosphoribosyltransferase [Lachnospiraceae bacterium]|nr:anthranilate phosphoribosyltransferase [Lachnospiraceae bacterium]
MIKEAISTLVNGQNLEPAMMTQVMEEIMTGEATDAQKASFLTALAIKGETIEEITEAAKVMRIHCAPFDNDMDTLEIVGTGGDKSNTINISTIASIITSASGIKVSKHGNRAASSKCGTADCLEALGVKIDLDADKSLDLLKDTNFCFLFAQKYHPAMRFVGTVRKEIGTRTMFNILGPLANPARANLQLMGVFDESLVEPLAHVLVNLGVKRTMVVYGMDCIDEISLSAPTKVCEYRDGEFKSYEITPEQFGFTRCEKSDLVGGEPAENAQIVKDILDGVQGPKTDAVIFNAGAAIYIATEGITLEEGIARARETLESGAAKKQLEDIIAGSNV